MFFYLQVDKPKGLQGDTQRKTGPKTQSLSAIASTLKATQGHLVKTRQGAIKTNSKLLILLRNEESAGSLFFLSHTAAAV